MVNYYLPSQNRRIHVISRSYVVAALEILRASFIRDADDRMVQWRGVHHALHAAAARVADEIARLPPDSGDAPIPSDVVAGLRLLRSHFHDGGHEWTSNQMRLAAAACAWIGDPEVASPQPQAVGAIPPIFVGLDIGAVERTRLANELEAKRAELSEVRATSEHAVERAHKERDELQKQLDVSRTALAAALQEEAATIKDRDYWKAYGERKEYDVRSLRDAVDTIRSCAKVLGIDLGEKP